MQMNDPFAYDVIGPQPMRSPNQLQFRFTDEDGIEHPDMDIGGSNVAPDGEDDADGPQAEA